MTTHEDAWLKTTRRFLTQSCEFGPGLTVRATPLYTAWCAWLKANGNPSESATAFGRRLSLMYPKKRTTGGVVAYVGLTLKNKEN